MRYFARLKKQIRTKFLKKKKTGVDVRELSTEIIIRAPAGNVWRILTDFSRYPEWNPFIKKIEGDSVERSRLIVQIVFDKNSYVAENYKPSAQIKIDLTLEKRPGAGWLIRCAELRGIDGQPLSWRQAR